MTTHATGPPAAGTAPLDTGTRRMQARRRSRHVPGDTWEGPVFTEMTR